MHIRQKRTHIFRQILVFWQKESYISRKIPILTNDVVDQELCIKIPAFNMRCKSISKCFSLAHFDSSVNNVVTTRSHNNSCCFQFLVFGRNFSGGKKLRISTFTAYCIFSGRSHEINFILNFLCIFARNYKFITKPSFAFLPEIRL